MSDWYTLDKAGKVLGVVPTLVGAQFWERHRDEYQIKTEVPSEIGPLLISTVFLGFDHAFPPSEKRELFETMAFLHGEEVHGLQNEFDGFQQRYSTYAEAKQGHLAAADAFRGMADEDE